MPLKLEIVTPESRVFSDEVDSVVLPGTEGEMGVLPAHAPLVTMLKPGELRFVRGGKAEEFVVGEGMVEVTGSTVRVLTDLAMNETAIDETHVQEALARAEARMKEADLGPEEIASVEAVIAKSVAQLHFKRKRRSI
ncbi:MAG: ATP synthase F1 subunit epsilon [Verrucomicrobiaceae bacterium]